MFYDGLQDYSILVQEIPPASNDLIDVLIYDYSEGSQRQRVIKATRGEISTAAGGGQLELILHEGELHRRLPLKPTAGGEQYERLAFDRLRLRLELADFAFERSEPEDGYRSDRTMRTIDMVYVVDSLEARIAADRDRLRHLQAVLDPSQQTPPSETTSIQPPRPEEPAPPRNPVLEGLTGEEQQQAYQQALQEVRSTRSNIDDLRRTIAYLVQRADRYRVEIHKKFSIATACLIFMLIGAPLGLSIRRGGLGTAGALAIGIFLFYWVTLVQGEKLADRGHLTPWVGMWAANLVMLLIGLALTFYVAYDLRATPRLWTRLRRLLHR